MAFDILESLRMPLPSPNIQKQLVKDCQDKSGLAILQEQQARDKKTWKYIYKELEIVSNKNTKKCCI